MFEPNGVYGHRPCPNCDVKDALCEHGHDEGRAAHRWTCPTCQVDQDVHILHFECSLCELTDPPSCTPCVLDGEMGSIKLFKGADYDEEVTLADALEIVANYRDALLAGGHSGTCKRDAAALALVHEILSTPVVVHVNGGVAEPEAHPMLPVDVRDHDVAGTLCDECQENEIDYDHPCHDCGFCPECGDACEEKCGYYGDWLRARGIGATLWDGLCQSCYKPLTLTHACAVTCGVCEDCTTAGCYTCEASAKTDDKRPPDPEV